MALARTVLLASLAGCLLHPGPKGRPQAESRDVVLTFDDSGFFARTMMANAETILPPTCEAPLKGARAVLCSAAFRKLAHDHGAASAHVVDMESDAGGATYVFASVITGSGECGAYGFWAIRVDKSVHVTPPIEGCFMLQESATAEKRPTIHWGPPLSLDVQELSKPVETFVLDEDSYKFVRRRR